MTAGKGRKKTRASHNSTLGSPGSRLKRIRAERSGNPVGTSLNFESNPDPTQEKPREEEYLTDTVERGGYPSSYFSRKTSGSSKSVADLGISLANESELRALVAKLPERLSQEKSMLVDTYMNNVRRIASQWKAGFSLLFYGYGSKFELLKMLLKECSAGYPAILIDGLSQRVNCRSILMNILAISKDSSQKNFTSMSNEEMLKEIATETTHQRIFVMLSNIDAPGLRSYGDQRLLSDLASIPRLHFGASIDHVNAPLMWDLQTRDRFSWSWHHVPTFKPYVREVSLSSLPSLFLGRKYVYECLGIIFGCRMIHPVYLFFREACTQESAAVVLSSLSNNAREVFRCIADAQLDPEGNGGITFQSLFNVCKEKFLASNENILKTFLTEFKDHDILQTKYVVVMLFFSTTRFGLFTVVSLYLMQEIKRRDQ